MTTKYATVKDARERLRVLNGSLRQQLEYFRDHERARAADASEDVEDVEDVPEFGGVSASMLDHYVDLERIAADVDEAEELVNSLDRRVKAASSGDADEYRGVSVEDRKQEVRDLYQNVTDPTIQALEGHVREVYDQSLEALRDEYL